MATKLTLDAMQAVELRDCWDHEALDFTPWLANNLALLGEAIGMDLELVGTEQSVGNFNADILCRNTGTGEWVLIENQLAGTDHSHLGQLLTYTAGLNASTIIWVCRRFREEHRAALDWLNEHTVSDVRFFGLEIQLWRIGNSGSVAPRFNTVCQPNNYSKVLTAQKESGNASAGNGVTSFRLRYWTTLIERLKSVTGTPLKPQSPKDQNWTSFALGRAGFVVNPVIVPQKKAIRTELYLYGPNAKQHFRLLQQQQEAIEEELGPLKWEELPTGNDSRISLYQYNCDPTDETAWDEQQTWLLKHSTEFYNTFKPRVMGLSVPKSNLNTSDMASFAGNDDATDS